MKLRDLTEMAAVSFTKVRSIFKSNFAKRKLELGLPTHSHERAVDGERGDSIAEEDLIQALQKFLKKFDAHSGDVEKVFKQAEQDESVEVTFRYAIDDTFVNFPTVIKHLGNGRYKFIIKTLMVKKNFKTHENDIVINL
jgi:ABC-type transporter Mla subunit MlaD